MIKYLYELIVVEFRVDRLLKRMYINLYLVVYIFPIKLGKLLGKLS